MKKQAPTRLLSALLALVVTVALLPLSVLSAAADDEVVLDPFEYGEKTAFTDHLPTYDSEAERVNWRGGWQVGVRENATDTFMPFAVMDEYDVISLAGQIWGGAGGGLYIGHGAGKIAFSGCMPGGAYVSEVRYTAQHSGRAVLNYDQLYCIREGGSPDYIGFSFSVYLNDTRIWPSDAEWVDYQSAEVISDANYWENALSAVRGSGLPLMVALEEGDVISFRTRQLNSNTWMLHANPTVTYTLIEHDHIYGAWAPYDAAQHVRACSCGKESFAPHAWNGGTVIKPATHMTEGERFYTCTECGATKTEPISKLPGHTFEGAWQPYSDTQHTRFCACGEPEYASHTWDAGTVITPPTVFEEGVAAYTCTGCGATGTAPIAKVAKTAGDVNGDGIVTNADALAYFRYIYSAEEYPLAVPEMADVSGDGAITNADVLLIFRYIYSAEDYPIYYPMSPEEDNELPFDSILGL